MGQALEWQIERSDNASTLTFSGDITESSDFTQLLAQLVGQAEVEIDLAAIRRINSSGIRNWINFIQPLSSQAQVALLNCPPVVINQLNVISNFSGQASIKSILAPFICENCDIEANIAIALQPGVQPSLPKVICESCGLEMEFDDLEEDYFSFLES